MKNFKKILAILLAFTFLVGCGTKKKDNEIEVGKKDAEQIYEVLGRTFYNRSEQNPERRESITLYKEGDFELYEYTDAGLKLFRGEYKQRDNEYHLYPTDSKLPEKIVFRAVSEEELVLDVDIISSMFGDSFVLEALLPPAPEKKDEDPIVFYNAYEPKENLGVSNLELYKDGTFKLTEVQGMGATLVEGRYGREGDVYMFSNFEPFNDMYQNKVYNFEFMVFDENTIILNEDLSVLPYGSIMTRDGEIPEAYLSHYSEEVVGKFVHYSIDGVNDEYLPSIELRENGEFTFVENCYSGMIPVYGRYHEIPSGYYFEIMDAYDLQGYAGQDVTEFKLLYDYQSGYYKMDTDICMTRANDLFAFYYYGDDFKG